MPLMAASIASASSISADVILFDAREHVGEQFKLAVDVAAIAVVRGRPGQARPTHAAKPTTGAAIQASRIFRTPRANDDSSTKAIHVTLNGPPPHAACCTAPGVQPACPDRWARPFRRTSTYNSGAGVSEIGISPTGLPRPHPFADPGANRLQPGENQSVTTVQVQDQDVAVAAESSGIGHFTRCRGHHLGAGCGCATSRPARRARRRRVRHRRA